MKKKIISLCLVLALALTAIGGATLAYFTDTDSAENTFVVGNVKIVQNEKDRNNNDFKQNQNIKPAVLDKLKKEQVTVGGYTFNIRSTDGNYVDKIVSVTNKGTEKAYMRTIIAVPSMNGYDDATDATENPLHWNYLDATDFEGTGWDWNGNKDATADPTTDKVSNVTINGVVYDLYIATHNEAVAPGATTAPSMVGFYLDDDVNCDENGYFSMQNGKRIDLSSWMKPDAETGKVTMKILVATQACQIEGFTDAWEALDTCFGDITATNHPWAK